VSLDENASTKDDECTYVKNKKRRKNYVVERASRFLLSVVEASIYAARPLSSRKPNKSECHEVVENAYQALTVLGPFIAHLKYDGPDFGRKLTVDVKRYVTDTSVPAKHVFTYLVHVK
jgi:hypothetical protein